MPRDNWKKARILIVDDQESNIALLEDMLQTEGYASLRSVTDSRRALATYEEFQPDLILLDLMMPYLDGLAVMEQLRPRVPDETYLPILVLTADITLEAKRRVLAAGAKDFLTKPFDDIEVLLRIKNLLETRLLYLHKEQLANERIQEQAALLDRANDAILNCDLDDRITFWNEGATRLYGWTATEAVGQNADRLFSAGPAAELLGARQAVLETGKWSGELRHRRKDGKEITVASRWTLKRDEEGRPKSKLVIHTDITERKSLEAQLRQSQKMDAFGQLAGGVAHDFNNLLTIITGYSEVILSGVVPANQQPDFIREIRKAGDRAASLTRQLLAFSRKQMLQAVVLELNTLVTEVEKMLRRLIGEDIDLAMVLDPALGQVKADPGQIEQVILNLVVNARDAMPTGGHLTIETRNLELDQDYAQKHPEVQPGKFVMLAVTDSGCGMDEATRARIFEPFFTTKEVGKGTGLGLATVYGIVKQSGGGIEVYSEVDRGTTLKIYLPRHEATVSSGKSLPGHSLVPRGTETILLAEDQEEVRAIVRLALESKGYTVLAARNGNEAMQLCKQHSGPIHLLMTDVVMPKMNGRQLAVLVVDQRPQIKVLYLSGYTDDAVVRHGVLETEMAFLQKPFTPMDLARKVREVLNVSNTTNK